MAYQTLYRKWRPQTFDQVVGQEHIRRTLESAVRTGRIAHAYLFAGPRGTGKSYVYRDLSPYAILISGGKTTVANLFYNMSTRRVGLVGMWDVVAFDEVAGISFRDKTAIQILKDYMESGSFSRGVRARWSMFHSPHAFGTTAIGNRKARSRGSAGYPRTNWLGTSK